MIVLEKFILWNERRIKTNRIQNSLLFDLYLSSSQLLSGRVITRTTRTINRSVLLLYIIDTRVYRGSICRQGGTYRDHREIYLRKHR